MTAPGDNLEFQASLYFRARVGLDSLLLEKVKDILQKEPHVGSVICPGIRELSFEFEGENFALIFSRRGNRISLMHIYRNDEKEPLAAKKKYLIRQNVQGGKPWASN